MVFATSRRASEFASTPGDARLRRAVHPHRGRAAALTALAAFAALLGGCGTDRSGAGPSTPAGSTSRAQPGIVHGRQNARDGRLVVLPANAERRHGLTRRMAASVRGRLAVTAGHGRVVVGWAGDSASGLQIAAGTEQRNGEDLAALPVPVRTAAGVIPRWAEIHLGSDRRGRLLVAYPRCRTKLSGSCDVFAYPLDGVSGADEQALDAVNTAHAETEAVVDRGAVLAVRERSDDLDLTPPYVVDVLPSRTTLLIARPGQRARVLTREGGRRIALSIAASRAAMLLWPRDEEMDDGVCGTSHVRMIDLRGGVKRDQGVTCGLAGQMPTTPQVTARRTLRYGIALLAPEEGTGSAYRWPATAEQPTRLALHTPFVVDWLATSATAGWALIGVRDACAGLWEAKPSPCELMRIDGLLPR